MSLRIQEDAKKDILSTVQESIDQRSMQTEGAQVQGNPEANTDKLLPPNSTILYSQNPLILEKGPVATLLNHLLRSSVL